MKSIEGNIYAKAYKKRQVVKNVSLKVNKGRDSWSFRTEWCRKNNNFLYDNWYNKTRKRKSLLQ